MDHLVNNSPRTDCLGVYDAIAPYYAEYSIRRKSYLDAIDKLVIDQLKPHHRLLDIGSGDGHRLAKIMSLASIKNAVAIEPSREMVKLFKRSAQVPIYEVTAENISQLDIGKFDVAIALWNVFGHIPNSPTRIDALKKISAKLTKGGLLILDVNNRHNAAAYGKFKVFMRTLVDAVWFKESRGDASYTWKNCGQVIQSKGHLFTPFEMEHLFSQAELSILNRKSVNYATGEVSTSPYRGQLVYVLTPR